MKLNEKEYFFLNGKSHNCSLIQYDETVELTYSKTCRSCPALMKFTLWDNLIESESDDHQSVHNSKKSCKRHPTNKSPSRKRCSNVRF